MSGQENAGSSESRSKKQHEVFNAFGIAAYQANTLEVAITTLLATVFSEGKGSSEDFIKEVLEFEKVTLGQLIDKLKSKSKNTKIDFGLLCEAWVKRDWLIHWSLKVQSADFSSEPWLQRFQKELSDASALFKRAHQHLLVIFDEEVQKVGLNGKSPVEDKVVNDFFARLKAERESFLSTKLPKRRAHLKL